MDNNYTVFVHLIDKDGRTVLHDDQRPTEDAWHKFLPQMLRPHYLIELERSILIAHKMSYTSFHLLLT